MAAGKRVLSVTFGRDQRVELLPANPARRKAWIMSLSSVVHLGADDTVSNAEGYPLRPGETIVDDVPSTDAWWACGTQDDNTVRVIEVSS